VPADEAAVVRLPRRPRYDGRDRFEGLIPIFWRRIAITAANPPRSWFDVLHMGETDCVAGHIGFEL
jgi:hypothetical protein